ncbi:PIN domain-containing protein [Metallosphaera hakonensis]|nr:PIN domain-containing protein [Metallosphaera hakonensis]
MLTESVLQEFAEFTYEKYVENMNASKEERALGYLKFFRYTMELISKHVLLVHSYRDYLEAMDLSRERSIDITDALITVAALRSHAVVITRDRDFERVRDLIGVEILK